MVTYSTDSYRLVGILENYGVEWQCQVKDEFQEKVLNTKADSSSIIDIIHSLDDSRPLILNTWVAHVKDGDIAYFESQYQDITSNEDISEGLEEYGVDPKMFQHTLHVVLEPGENLTDLDAKYILE